MTTNSDNDSQSHRPIRSFVIRSGRMTAGQRLGLNSHLEQWGLTLSDTPIDFSDAFGNNNPVVMEIGFGMGDSLAEMAEANPQWNFIGVEVHAPGVGRLMALVEKKSLENVRVFSDDAVKVLQQCTAANSLNRLNIYFPDPWHKTKHHKRRLIQAEFLALAHSRLETGGLLHIATDWQDYTKYVLKLMQGQSLFENVATNNEAAPFVSPQDYGRPETKFERRGHRLGHGVWDMVFKALAKSPTE